MLKKLSGVVVGLGLLGSQACAVDGMDQSDIDSVDQEVACYTNTGSNPMFAALAVAMAKEIKELNPSRDLQVVPFNGWDKMVVLSNEGRNRCNANGGCNNIDDIIGMQYPEVNWYVDQNVFNATNFRSRMVSQLDEQKNFEANLQRNNPGGLPKPHKLSQQSVDNLGGCGKHFTFKAERSDCSSSGGSTSSGGSCDGLRTWKGNDYTFTVQSGEVIQHNGRRYKANQYIGYPNAECAPSAPASWCSSWFSDQGACTSGTTTTTTTSTCTLNTSDIQNRLYMFGGSNNPYLDFRSTDSTISIDPVANMNDVPLDTSSGSCGADYSVYDPTGAINGTCCSVNGAQGVYVKHPNNRLRYTYICNG